MIKFKILANNYLSESTNAFHHVKYTGMNNPENPDYLNYLKNTFNDFSQIKLQSAIQKLQSVLAEDLPKIHQLLGFDVITVCVVCRAKAENFYHLNQQLFRSTVKASITQRPGFADGTNYIQRHTNTKTTHLKKPVSNYPNDGELPYPGITLKTCKISPNVMGKDILLIDDIYTPSVNIDEDAINALLSVGARTVTFYSVAKV